MAAVTMAPGLPPPRSRSVTDDLSTLPDPRNPLAISGVSRSSSNSPHPDLDSEVATLSNKLINAINHQTNLDDTLSETRLELDSSRERVRQLESEARRHAAMMASGVLVHKKDVEDNTMKLLANLADERRQRGVVEKDKKGIEQEIETLTTALFEEANEMVAAARKERELAERRNDQLRAQLNDTELLLASHQEQLADLKTVMQQMSSDREEPETTMNASTAPSTPALGTQDYLSKISDTLHLSPTTLSSDEVPPAPPTSFTHLLRPVLRTDLQAYDEFHCLLQMSRKHPPSSRVTSGTYSGLNVVGLGNLTNREQSQSSTHLPSNGSTSSLATSNTYQSSPIAPSSTNSSVSSRDAPLNYVPLKETRFYKRTLTEDIEPTLRLDTAPGLSWLARRTVINSMSEGSLIVEPMASQPRLYILSCSLCGENREGEEHSRTHRFRTSGSENAQRYPLCNYCLNRIRASCDFFGFLRMIKDGLWRTDGIEAELVAWEESVRLRERLFWARIGGGVIPAFVRARDSPRSSVEGARPNSDLAAPETATNGEGLKIMQLSPSENEDPFRSSEKHVSTSHPSSLPAESKSNTKATWGEMKVNTRLDQSVDPVSAMSDNEEDLISKQIHSTLQDSLPGKPMATGTEHVAPPQYANEQRLSVTIPGAFDF